MLHEKRRWCVGPVESVEALAEKLTGHTWTLCTAFSVRSYPQYLFLNDSTSEDWALEFAVLKVTPEGHRQIESITFGWCSEFTALRYIRQILAGDFDTAGVPVQPLLDTLQKHRCHHCA